MTLFQEPVLFKRSDKVSIGILTKLGVGVSSERGLRADIHKPGGHISNATQRETLTGDPDTDWKHSEEEKSLLLQKSLIWTLGLTSWCGSHGCRVAEDVRDNQSAWYQQQPGSWVLSVLTHFRIKRQTLAVVVLPLESICGDDRCAWTTGHSNPAAPVFTSGCRNREWHV